MKHNAVQFTLLPEEDLQNSSAKTVWKKREVDRLLDFYFSGADLGRIAASLQRNRKAVVRKLQEYIYNERERVRNYRPRQRTTRTGKRISPNEDQLIKECRKKGVCDKQIAAVLARKVEELPPSGAAVMEKVKVKSMAPFAATLELVLAHRYIFHNYRKKVISNATYDALKAEEEEYGPQNGVLANTPGHCPSYIKTLALYLIQRTEFQQDNKIQ